MRFMKRLLLFIIVIGTGYYIVTQTTMIPPTLIDRVKDKTLELMDMNELKKLFQEEENDLPEKEVEKLAIQEDLFSWIGKDPAALEKELGEDRKSTRLNSSHVAISYAVLCLKK